MMKDGTPDFEPDGSGNWLHFSVKIHGDSPTLPEEIADDITGREGVLEVYQITNDGFGSLVRGRAPIARPDYVLVHVQHTHGHADGCTGPHEVGKTPCKVLVGPKYKVELT